MNNTRAIVSILLTAGSFVFAADQPLDPRHQAEFDKCVAPQARLVKLAGDMAFLEGPTWHPEGFLVFSDIPNNELKKWTPDGALGTFRRPSQNANGNTIDGEGRLVSAEHSGRRISLTLKDGTVKTLTGAFEGRKFNSPNDVVVKSDGTVWFTDPPYGTPKGEERELKDSNVYRYDPKTERTTVVVAEAWDRNYNRPNGLCFSPDEKKLYVADSGTPRAIRVFEVTGAGVAQEFKVFCRIDKGGPDGIRCDAAGRIWSSAGDGVHIFAPDGSLIGKILVPESPANLCFGGADGRTLYITARKSLYSIPVRVTAAPKH